MKELNKVYIGPATIEDFNLVMQDKVLYARLTDALDGAAPTYNPDHYFVTKLSDYIMLFTLWEKSAGIYEAHVAVPSSSVKASRALALLSTNWIFNTGFQDCRAIYVCCPKGKIANFAARVGYQKLNESDTHITFAFTNPKFTN